MLAGISRRRGAKIGAIIQLAVFALLQLSLILPPLAQAITAQQRSSVCRGDHALCGCAPARIAAGTCCCAISALPACCQKEAKESAAGKGAEITLRPCGSADPVIAAIIDVYLPGGKQLLVVKSGTCPYRSSSPEQTLQHCDRPAIPPPQSSLLS